jgi:hypothetical protein
MSKAARPSSKLTRRAAIATTLAGAAAPSVTRPVLAASDPVFALIAVHKATNARHEQVCRIMSDLEGQIPQEKRQEWYAGDRAEGIGADDDPRWRAANTAYWTAFGAEEKAAWSIAHARPASLAGTAALLRYAYEHEAQRCEWPDGRDPEDADMGWHGAFHSSLAAALEAMSA